MAINIIKTETIKDDVTSKITYDVENFKGKGRMSSYLCNLTLDDMKELKEKINKLEL